TFGLGEFERIHRGDGTDFEGFDWKPEIVRRTGRRSEVKDIANFSLDSNAFRNVLAFEAEFRISSEVAKIVFIAGNQIVKRQHFPANGQEMVAQMRPEESRSTRDHCSHLSSRTLKAAYFNLLTRKLGNRISTSSTSSGTPGRLTIATRAD